MNFDFDSHGQHPGGNTIDISVVFIPVKCSEKMKLEGLWLNTGHGRGSHLPALNALGAQVSYRSSDEMCQYSIFGQLVMYELNQQ